MKNRPLIGINSDYRATAKGRVPQTFLHSGYYDCLLAAGAVPVVIPPLTKEDDLTPILDRLDGVLLTGGDDLDPKKMGLAPHPSVTVMNDRRETADRMLIKLVPAAQDARPGCRDSACSNSTSSTAVESTSTCPKTCPARFPTVTRRAAFIATSW